MTPPTHTADCSAIITEFTTSESGTPPHSYKPTKRLLTRKRTIDHMVDRYILLKLLETSLPEYTRNNYEPLQLGTHAKPEIRKILAKSLPKIDQNAKQNYI